MGSYTESTNMLEYLRTKSKVDCDSLDVPRLSIGESQGRSSLTVFGSRERAWTLCRLDEQPG